MRISSSGSDFCDFCTKLKDDLKSLSSSDFRYKLACEGLLEHRKNAENEFKYYKDVQTQCYVDNTNEKRHYVFDFAEKVLLPRLKIQPGQLHFITGLKFDLFGVSSSNDTLNYIFGLPEDH